MGDNGEMNNAGKAEVVLTITLLPDGRVNLSGPISNRMLCYGLLKMAEEIVYSFSLNGEKAQKVLLPQRRGIMDFIRRK